jgi:hypothetical protein
MNILIHKRDDDRFGSGMLFAYTAVFDYLLISSVRSCKALQHGVACTCVAFYSLLLTHESIDFNTC